MKTSVEGCYRQFDNLGLRFFDVTSSFRDVAQEVVRTSTVKSSQLKRQTKARTLTDKVSPRPLPDKKMPSWAVVRGVWSCMCVHVCLRDFNMWNGIRPEGSF